jgi:hypothetical protein
VNALKLTATGDSSRLSDLQSHLDQIVGSAGLLDGGPGGGRGGAAGPASTAVASYLGLTAEELGSDLAAGKTLADLAAAQGKPVSGLEAAILTDAKTQLDAAVAAGTLTTAQESTMLSDLQSHLDDIVDGSRPPGESPGGPPLPA